MKRKWTSADLQGLANKGVSVVGFESAGEKKKYKKRITRSEAPQLLEMKQWLTIMGIPFESEYRFTEERKFRFDIALKEHKIAFEYEGIVGKFSRHTNIKGYTRDTEKYNMAQSQGWRVFRYTALNYKNFLSDLKTLLNL